jgi:RecA-family ATPase
MLLTAKPKVGKSTLAGFMAQAWGCESSPWEGAPALPGSRALILSAEQPVERIDATLRRMDVPHDQITRDKWSERVTILARDPELPKSAARMFTLDDTGRALLRQSLLRAKREGDPYGLVVLDSLSRLAPDGMDENSNMEATAFLAPLQELAEELGVYIIMIHHVGHAGRGDAVSAGRGASAIAAVAQAVWLLSKADSNPRQRTLKIEGNAVSEASLAFEVAGEENEPGAILYWKPVDPLDVYDVTELLADAEEINTTELARRIQKPPPEEGKRPGRSALSKATQLRNEWKKAKRIEVRKGKYNALMMRRTALAE